MTMINCAEGTIDKYIPSNSKPWNLKRSIHLSRRIGLGASYEAHQNYLTQSPEDIVSQIVEEAANLPLAPEPEWAFWQLSDYSPNEGIRNQQLAAQYIEWATRWTKDLKNNKLRDRMSWFWHNHFVTRLEDYLCPSWLYQYHKLLQQYALGNFKEFVREIGITPAMLVFLNNIQNTRFEPNENYARELFELFTLGVDNGYTQMDIEETARAITGWSGIDVTNLCGEVNFLEAFWDPGRKTIFGQTGNWNYDDVIDILFEQRQVEISEYICTQLYTHFVNPDPDELIIGDLAAIFRQNDWELKPVLLTMFSSDHFYEEANIGTVIPGHIEFFLMFLNELNFRDVDEIILSITFSADEFDQRIFNPTDVSGWPGNRNWINSSSLPFRWKAIFDIMAYYFVLNNQRLDELIDLAKSLADGNENDATFITNSIIEYFLPKGLQFDREYEEALAVFKSEVPENYFEDGTWNLNWDSAPAQVFYLINHIANLPEFQLR